MCTIVVNASTWPLNESADSLSALVLIKSLIVSRKHGGRVDCQTVYVPVSYTHLTLPTIYSV